MFDSNLNVFLEKTPQEIKKRLCEIISSKDEIYFSFNWLGLASVLTTDVNQEINNRNLEKSVLLSEIVFQVRRIISEIHSDYFHQNEYSEMILRARLINTFGNKSNDPILDAEIIYQWFFERLEMNIFEAIDQSKIFFENLDNGKRENIDIDIVRKIRQIKTRVSVISILNENPNLKVDNQLVEWLKIRTLLV